MLSETEKRAACLAVSRYGADASRVSLVVESLHELRTHGDPVDLLDIFQRENLLTAGQASEIRFGLEKTMVDPVVINGSAKSGPFQSEALLPPQAVEEEDNEENEEDSGVLGNFRLLRRLGKGSTGTVYLAFQEKENRQVAIKILSKSLAKNQSALDRFYREAKSGALLNHPNIVRNLAVGQDKATGKHYLVLEYVDGPSALDLLDKYRQLPVGDGLQIIIDIARALEHAHSRNVVHRDIKPGNILLTSSGLAKLADMGLAKRVDEASHLTHARQGFGTPYYMPYEQAMNAKNADARGDIYALGATLYHLIVGEVPFTGINTLEIVDKKEIGDFIPASQMNPQVPRVVDAILMKMMAREPRDRYQTASELLVDLERSNLASALPSFVDHDLALRDPLVRQRLTGPGATSPDLRPGVDRPPDDGQIWFLRYRDRQGKPCKAKLAFEQVLHKLRAGKISPRIEAARFLRGSYKPLDSYVEFQKVLEAQPKTKQQKRIIEISVDPAKWTFRGWWIALGSGLGIVLLLAVTIILWLRGS